MPILAVSIGREDETIGHVAATVDELRGPGERAGRGARLPAGTRLLTLAGPGARQDAPGDRAGGQGAGGLPRCHRPIPRVADRERRRNVRFLV